MTTEANQTTSLPPLPEPFPEPASVDRKRPRRNCLVTGLAGCGLTLVLIIVGLFVLVSQADELLEIGLDFSQERILAALPDDVPHEERERLKRACDSVLEHYRSQGGAPADGRRLRMAFTDAFGRVDRGLFDRDDLRRLTERLERIAASGPGG